MKEPLDHQEEIRTEKKNSEKEIGKKGIFIIGIILFVGGCIIAFFMSNYKPSSLTSTNDQLFQIPVVMILSGTLALIAGLIRLIQKRNR